MEIDQAIELQSLYKNYRVKTSVSLFKPSFKDIAAIRGISFIHDTRQNLGVFGKNGAGKTTLIKMLTGILHPSSGSINVMGYTPYNLKSEFKSKIALFQGGKQNLVWDIPAIMSLELSRYIYGYSKQDFNHRLSSFAEALDLGDELNQPPRNMSLGQRSKMELIYSFIHLPKVVFLDEPTSGLDIITRSKFRDFINFCHTEYEICFVITSHNVKDITDCCKSCIVLEHGQIIYQGDKDFLLEKHQHELITLRADSDCAAIEISNVYGGKVNGTQVTIESLGSNSNALICKIMSQYLIKDFKVARKDDEEIIAEILKNA